MNKAKTKMKECYYNSISLYRATELAFDNLLKENEKEYFVLLGYKNSTPEIFNEMVENKYAIEGHKKKALKTIWENFELNSKENNNAN